MRAVHLRNKRFLYIIGLIAGLNLAGGARADYLRLHPLHLPFQANGTILWAASTSTFALSDTQLRLRIHDPAGWRAPIQPPDGSWRTVQYSRSTDSIIRAFCIDSEYNTRVYRLSGGHWIPDGLRAKLPVSRFYETESGEWAVGDWGSLYHHDKGFWRKIEVPSRNHVLVVAQQGKDSLWFAFRGDGLVLRTPSGDSFIDVPGQEASDIDRLQPFGRELIVSLANGSVWRVSESGVRRWRPVGAENARWVGMEPGDSTFIFLSPGVFYRVSLTSVQQVSLPYDQLRDIYVFADGSSLLLTQAGDLVAGVPGKGAFFYELSARMRIGGSPGDKTLGAAPADLDGDSHPELFVLNGGSRPYNQLFSASSAQGPYSDITRSAGLLTTRGATHAAFGDVNGDGLTDLVFTRAEGSGTVLEAMLNIGRDRFGPPRRIPFDAPAYDPPVDLSLVDANRDGHLDIVLGYYYGSGDDRRGKNVLLLGRGFGSFAQDSKNRIGLAVSGWIEANLFADLDRDGWLDALVMTRWIRDKLLWGGPDGFREDSAALPDTLATATYAAVALDFDHDGDLDLALCDGDRFLRLFENAGDRRFIDASRRWLPPGLPPRPAVVDLRCADLDGNGWTDLLVAGGAQPGSVNHVLLGSPAGFHEAAGELGLEHPSVNAFVPFDMEADGDVDLLGLRDGSNILWVNQQEHGGTVTLDLRASRSNPSALHAAWRVYPAGSLDRSDSLSACGQLAVEGSRGLSAKGLEKARIGLQPDRRWDLRVRFYGGKSRVLRSVPSGSRLLVRDYPSIVQTGFLFPARAVALLQRRNVQFHLLGFLAGILMLGATLQFGSTRFQWSTRFLVVLALGTVTVWWLMVLLTSGLEGALRFVAPPGAVLAIAVLTLGLSVWMSRHGALARERSWDDLLQALLVFAHGAWASSNLDSIRRLGEFVLREDMAGTPEQMEQLRRRAETWQGMTEPNLRRIVELAGSLRMAPAAVAVMEECRGTINVLLADRDNWPNHDSSSRGRIAARLKSALDQLRDNLRRLRNAAYQRYSCNVPQVVRQTVGELEPAFAEADVPPPSVDQDARPVWGLIRGWELADILDNCLRNAVRAVKDAEERRIAVDVEATPGRIRVHVSDTGCGIPENEWDRIFEEGMSGSDGTGHGLAQARTLLARVGGNIFVTESRPGQGTTFTIQLNEGRENFEASDSYR